MRDPKIILRVPVAISKGDITPLMKYVGKLNQHAYHGRKARTIKYHAYAGALRKSDGLYVGEYQFVEATEQDTEASDFGALPDASKKQPIKNDPAPAKE